MTSNKVTYKSIEECLPSLIVSLVAETVAEKVVAYKMQAELDNWDNLPTKEAKDALDRKYMTEVQRVQAYLYRRAQTTFQHNERFYKNVLSKKNNGNWGRDYLYMFMFHWVGFDAPGGQIKNATPVLQSGLWCGYDRSIANYERAEKASETTRLNRAAWGEQAITEMGADEAVDIAVKEFKKESGIKITDKSSPEHMEEFYVWYYIKVNGTGKPYNSED